MTKKKLREPDIIVREEDGILVLEVKLSKKLEKEMAALAEKTAGTIQAI